jgi:hypothetical protein
VYLAAVTAFVTWLGQRDAGPGDALVAPRARDLGVPVRIVSAAAIGDACATPCGAAPTGPVAGVEAVVGRKIAPTSLAQGYQGTYPLKWWLGLEKEDEAHS